MSKSISLIFLVLTVVISALAYPHPQNEGMVLYKSGFDDKGFNFQYERSDGVARNESGKFLFRLSPDAKGDVTFSVEGVYTFTDDKGEKHSTNFIADENGYRLLH